MGRLLEFKAANDSELTIQIETAEVEGDTGGLQQAGGKISFEELLKIIRPFCEAIITNLQQLSVKPNSASAEFGVKISAKGSLFIVEASGEATLKITLNWAF